MDLASPNLIRPRRRGRTSSLLCTFWSQLGSDSLSFSSLSTRGLHDYHASLTSPCGPSLAQSPRTATLGLSRRRIIAPKDDIPTSPTTLRTPRSHKRKAAPAPLDIHIYEVDIERSLPSSATIPYDQRIKERQATPFASSMGVDTLLALYNYDESPNTLVEFDFGLYLPLVEHPDGSFTFGDDSLVSTPGPSPHRQTSSGVGVSAAKTTTGTTTGTTTTRVDTIQTPSTHLTPSRAEAC